MANKLTDTDLMPFGKYKGIAMQDVPVSYLHWLCHQDQTSYDGNRIKDYCKESISALKLEDKDLIWKL